MRIISKEKYEQCVTFTKLAQAADIIRNNHDIEDNIKTIFNDYGRNMDLFSNSMIQYLTLDTSKGYSEDGSYRYNRKLATKVLYNHYEINVTGKFSDSLQIK